MSSCATTTAPITVGASLDNVLTAIMSKLEETNVKLEETSIKVTAMKERMTGMATPASGTVGTGLDNAFNAILSKLEETNARLSTMEERMARMAYDGEKTQTRLGAIIELYERERKRCEDLEATNKSNTEKITRIRAGLIHVWDRVDILLWLQKNGIVGVGDVKVVKVEEGEVTVMRREDTPMEAHDDETQDQGSGSDEEDETEEVGRMEVVRDT